MTIALRKKINLIDNVDEKTLNSRSWLEYYDHPNWLENKTLHDDVWIIRDDGQSKSYPIYWSFPIYDPVNDEVSMLTDKDNSDFSPFA